jgi:TolB-like protein
MKIRFEKKSTFKLLALCALMLSLGGCAAGKLFMAGYQPPQTIADLLNEQYALAGEIPPNGITGRAAQTQARSNKPIGSDSYKGQLAGSDDSEQQSQREVSSAMMQAPVQRFRPQFTYKSVQDYAGQLAMDLLKNANGLTSEAKIGVTSFVKLDYTLQNTTVLGNQMAEYAISEIQQFGINVIDFKLMPAIAVSNKGDLAFSRDVMQLANSNVMNHVLSATMIDKADGVFINARIIEMGSNRVVSSASVLVPSFVSQQIHAQYVHYTPE